MDNEIIAFLKDEFGKVREEISKVNDRLGGVEERLDKSESFQKSNDIRLKNIESGIDDIKRQTTSIYNVLHDVVEFKVSASEEIEEIKEKIKIVK